VLSVAVTVITTNGTARAVSAKMSTASVFRMPSRPKKKYMPTAVITTGTIIGEISSPVTSPRHGISRRASPCAASVPSAVASRVVATPTIRLLRIAPVQRGLPKNSWYQRSENPASG